MTPNEFKAWFDGFTEAFTGCPTKAQWTRIRARVAEIDGKPVTQTVYLDRYVNPYVYPRVWGGIVGNGMTIMPCSTSTATGTSNAMGPTVSNNMIGSGGPAFNSLQAMTDLGRADANAIAA